MGVLFDYFAAPSDDVAATALDSTAGPATAQPRVFEAITFRVDPVVQLGTLESLLTGVPYDTVAADPRCGYAVAEHEEGEVVVVTVTDQLQAALASADHRRLAEVAAPWSRTDEFQGAADPGELAESLAGLASLARSAQQRGDRLYCWICL